MRKEGQGCREVTREKHPGLVQEEGGLGRAAAGGDREAGGAQWEGATGLYRVAV